MDHASTYRVVYVEPGKPACEKEIGTDLHLISFLINYPESDFVVEGLAMSFDGLWWGVPNETWVSYYKTKHPDLSVKALFDNNTFAETGCVITYPVAGAFSKFLIMHLIQPAIRCWEQADNPMQMDGI